MWWGWGVRGCGIDTRGDDGASGGFPKWNG